MFCAKCGNKLMDDEVFCRKCGTKVGGSVEETPSPIAPKPVQPPKPSPALTPEEIARRRAEAKKRNAKATRIVLLIILVSMLCCCFISCVAGLFSDSSDTPSDASASPSAKATATAKPTATPTPLEGDGTADDVVALLREVNRYTDDELAGIAELIVEHGTKKKICDMTDIYSEGSGAATYSFKDSNGAIAMIVSITHGEVTEIKVDGIAVYTPPTPTPKPTPKPTTAANYKVTCRSVDQKDVARNPSDYEGKNIKVTGEVVQVEEGWFDNVTLRLRVGDSYDEWAYWLITYTRKSDTESRILEGDTITAYGMCNGVETYTTILGSTNTVPSMDAEYIDIE